MAHEEDICRDDSAKLRWARPHGGARGQQITRWDNGWWVCEVCGIQLTPREAGTMLDAVLRISDPDCDSIDPETGVHGDAIDAFNGGMEKD